MKRVLLLSVLLSIIACGFGQSTSPGNQMSVRVVASVQNAPTSISLSWNEYTGATGYSVYRRTVDATTWGSSIADLPSSATGYTDMAVQLGVGYEYKVIRNGGGSAYGYIRSGIQVPPVGYRGKLVLLVESFAAPQINSDLVQLQADLLADGWIVLRHDVDADASPQSVRALVMNDFNTAPTQVKAVFIVGHVPVAYSGNIYPDGHTEHRGAWPCDGYYGEMNGSWTDNSVNTQESNFPWNHNVPGDGKFDQSDFPSDIELQVGRIDFDDMPSFPEGEMNMLRAYLAKAHQWKHAQFTVPTTAAVWDDLRWVSNPLSMSGFQSSAALVGLNSITELESTAAPFAQHYFFNDDLFIYQSGTGLQSPGPGGTVLAGTTGGLNSFDMLNSTRGAVFNMSMGSYFGDWDNSDNFLRAVIVRGNGLVHVWSGMPNWYFHPLAMGEPIGYCAVRSMNNTNSDYSLQNGGWQGQDLGRIHMGLMGDPTIRMRYLAPPSNLVATNAEWFSSFTWQPSPAQVAGYLIYRVDEANGTIIQVSDSIVVGTSYVSNEIYVPGATYMVRAVQLAVTASGSYYDLSLGAIAQGSGQPYVDCTGTLGGLAIPGTPCDDGDPLTQLDVYDAGCNCSGFKTGITPVIANALLMGPSPSDDILNVDGAIPGSDLYIRSVTGTFIAAFKVAPGRTAVDTRSLAPGTYILELRSTNENTIPIIRRFVVQH